ncbi:GmrSD restriction endonuclease domain-containing protein [Corynebacterium pseudogenitalium]|uniref:GmrSD restriction endonuclease domain-containing protein n=1 Tax=Corynebacterium pseudogenitalium TaxID=38303 RepID=UPI00210CD298|nr:DUF262 domain-containing protein [Corynebacterium pseudogenitalium]UUA87203.1 DUF262 domain-containing protein [Corynebacterium pseudogenitalium]
MASIFRTVPWDVQQLVNDVHSGRIQLPDLQRPFVWPTSKVRDLFDSMYRGYPVGELMFWDVAADGESRSISGDANFIGQHQIIDGQQRLTSLYAAIKGFPVRDVNYNEKRIRIAFNPFSEKFEVRTPPIAKSPEWVEDISTYFASSYKARKAFFKRYEESGGTLSDEEEEAVHDVFSKLSGLEKYRFNVVHLQSEADKRLVADVFVRINSEGVRLKAYDYILTWLSVFWPEGREQIEEFSRNSRMSPAHASSALGKEIQWTAHNPYIDVENGHLVRAMVAVGQRRGRLQDAYAALQAKDRHTGRVNSERQERELGLLKDALPVVVDHTNWTEFIRSIQAAGFRTNRNVTSHMNIIYSYVIFLLGRNDFDVELARLRALVARWLFMSQLTARYTGSSESQIQKDLDQIAALDKGDADGFEELLNRTISTQLTEDYWRFNLPQNLVTSGAALSPHYQCYLAALNILDAKMFMLNERVRDWMDPNQPAAKGTEGHHLFPRKYLEKVLGITDFKRINQVANFAPTDWATNIHISDRAPKDYWQELVEKRAPDEEWLKQQMYWHAIPEGWENMSYDEFLSNRRSLIAQVIRDAFAHITAGSAPVISTSDVEERSGSRTLQEFFEAGLLKPGDLLDPVDPDWIVDAVINEDGHLVIDGVNIFDSLDEATHSLGVTNLKGEEFWALEDGDDLVPLSKLSASS